VVKLKQSVFANAVSSTDTRYYTWYYRLKRKGAVGHSAIRPPRASIAKMQCS